MRGLRGGDGWIWLAGGVVGGVWAGLRWEGQGSCRVVRGVWTRGLGGLGFGVGVSVVGFRLRAVVFVFVFEWEGGILEFSGKKLGLD